MLIFHKLIAWLTITTAMFVICLQNPLYSIFFLIFTFLNGSLIILFLELEFLGLLCIMVYVGAVMILFLFTILSFNLKNLHIPAKKCTTKASFQFFFILCVLIQMNTLFFILEKLSFFSFFYFKNYFYFLQIESQNIQTFGLFLYTENFDYLALISFILLAAMFSSFYIVADNSIYKSQKDYKQRSFKSILFYQK